ncbi:hypothetical protein DFJ43DRAFT_1041348 [Lentinula guzmanii]|uniref:Uncharacterized protein n=1 Tax=Lentinula guzmanii TaxID=2804957 RepID=A0AA38MY59_9AGAR|nr:hypothetical protein DFJ43DRAFT_1041348 [Lentinula guzmanii]
MSPAASRTVPSPFGRASYELGSLQWERDDGSDSDDDDDDSSTSTSHSKQPQSTHSQSSQHGGDNSQHASGQITSNKSNAGAIAGGVIAGIIILAVLAFYWWKRRSFRNRPKVKIEIDPMSALIRSLTRGNELFLDGEAYTRKRAARKDEEQSLIYERTSTVKADLNPRPSQPQFWQVHNVSESDNMHDVPIPRNVPPNVEGKIVSDISKKHPRENSRDSISSVNLIPVPEKDFRGLHGYGSASSSKDGLKSSYSSVDTTSEKDTASTSAITKNSTLRDTSGPSAWKQKEGRKHSLNGSVEKAEDQTTSSRRFSEPEANDLALAAREEVLDLRRRVELLKQENAELTRRDSTGGSFERLPAYNE